jgi:hypothetical protein
MAKDSISGGPMTEFLVSSASPDPKTATSSLKRFVSLATSARDMSVVKTIGNEAGLKVVVVSTTEAALSQAIQTIPDLQSEKNQPLELFGPDN